MRDWDLLAPVLDTVEDMMDAAGVTYEMSSSLTVDRASHLLDSLGINVFDADALFDYIAGYSAALSVAHTVLHTIDAEWIDDDEVCAAMVAGTLQNLIPLMPLLPQETWSDQ